MYDHWRKAADRILKELWKLKEAWIFYEPVDIIKCNTPDYYSIIREPMDLGTIKSNLKKGLYDKPEQFEADMLKIFSNCFFYNGETSGVSLMCK
jgi:Bromodomain